MFRKYTIKKSIVTGTAYFMVIILLSPAIIAEIDIDRSDGIWTENFFGDPNVILNNCEIDRVNGTIYLQRTENIIKFDFTNDNFHKAYSYSTRKFPFLYPPNFHSKHEYELKEQTGELEKIKKREETEQGSYITTSNMPKKYNVHHFRFKLDTKPENIDELEIFWIGKAQHVEEIKLYFWKYDKIFPNLGKWEIIAKTDNNDQWETLDYTLNGSDIIQASNKNTFLDICVVGVHNGVDEICTLFSDYVFLLCKTKIGYSLENGFVYTKDAIDPKNISHVNKFSWGILTWDDFEIENATVNYQLYYEHEIGEFIPVENQYLPGNEQGFTKPPVYLNTIPTNKERYSKLKIKANLSTDDYLITPKMYSWVLTWQIDPNQWQDHFNYSFRVDEKNNVNIKNGFVSINPIGCNWPMIHQNPQNTRVAIGQGPKEFNLNWWCQIGDENASLANSVIMDGSLYLTTNNKKELYVIDNISSTPESGYEFTKFNIADLQQNKSIVNSPVVAEDKIIIATGETHKKGTENFVIALDRFNPNKQLWKFSYPEDICYFSSPIVVDNKVFITSWSGDPDFLQSNTNNKILALNIVDGSKLWDYDLPAGSFSTPAVYNETIVVGCKAKRDSSLFALTADTGSLIWKKSVGTIGRSSPVIYNDTVFVVSEKSKICRSQTRITALDINSGSIIGEKTICRNLFSIQHVFDRTKSFADTTPAIYNDVLYIAAPNGYIYALDANDVKNLIWYTKIEKWYVGNIVRGKFLITSPTYADGIIYSGTPSGHFFALNAATGEKINGWENFRTFKRIFKEGSWQIVDGSPPIVTSPVVSNELVFLGDNNGKLYSLGKFNQSNQDLEGHIISIPIILPEGYWWNRFYENKITFGMPNSSITFSILDENKHFIKEIEDGDNITGEMSNIIRLRADFYAKNSTFNPELFEWLITFKENINLPNVD
jgi:outer membrane protein assembly factor BamB